MSELVRANQHVKYLSTLSGQKAEVFGGKLLEKQMNKKNETVYSDYGIKQNNEQQLPNIKANSNSFEILKEKDETLVILNGTKYK